MHAPAGAIVGVAQFVRDARGPPLAVGRMAVNADKIDNGVTKGKAVVVLHTWKDHLWTLGSKGEVPNALPIAAEAAGDEQTSGVGDGGVDRNEGSVDAPHSSAGQEPADNAPAMAQGGPGPAITAEAEEVEKLTPEGTLLHAFRTLLF